MYRYAARVERWVDGDTVDVVVDLGFKVYVAQRLRLLGVDTPERGQPGFDEATAVASNLCPPGSAITIRTHKGTGKFGRYLAEVIDAFGVDVAKALIEGGHGKPYDGGKR